MRKIFYLFLFVAFFYMNQQYAMDLKKIQLVKIPANIQEKFGLPEKEDQAEKYKNEIEKLGLSISAQIAF